MRRKPTKDAFVTACNEVYGTLPDGRNKYDYTNFAYINNYTAGEILCVEHGIVFKQRPDNHLKGFTACERCPGPKGAKRKADVASWIEKSKEIHGDKYSYNNVGKPKNSKQKISLYCNTCKKDFETTFDAHLYHKVGCKCIARMKQSQSNYNKQQLAPETSFKGRFPNIAAELDPGSGINPENTAPFSHKKAKWICSQGCRYEMTIANRTKSGQACPICSGRRLDPSNCLSNNPDAVKFWHPTKNQKTPSDYTKGSGDWAWFTCDCDSKHDYYMRICNFHSGERCPYKGGKQFDPKDSLEARIPDIDQYWHNDKNKVSPAELSYGSGILCWLVCADCDNEWKTTPNNIKNGINCPACSPVGYSQAAIVWLNSLNDKNIQHAENGGEFRIPGTYYRADGYNPITNTIYEFHGTFWHGDPRVYDPDEYNSVTKCKFGELYQKTLKKEAAIKELGFNLIVIWEYDFK